MSLKVSREFKIGIIAIIAMILLYWGFNFLKGQDVFESKKVFYAIYDEVEGLSPARPVLVNGYKIGAVDDIYFHPDGSGRLMVVMNITSDFEISANSIASIQSTDLLGDKSIRLILGTSPEPAVSGDTLQSNVELSLTEEVNKQVAPLKTKIEKLFGTVDTVLTLLSGFLNEEAQNDFAKTFNSLRRSFQSLESTLATLDNTVTQSQGDIVSTFDNLSKITGTLEQNSEELNAIFGNLSSISDSLSKVRFKQTFQSLNDALMAAENILTKVDKGDGTLAKLINDPELYNNLSQASEQLDLLLLDIKYNPDRYIDLSLFGGSKPYDEEDLRKKEREAAEKRNSGKE